LKAYRNCFRCSPRQAFKDWKRIAFTCAAALGMGWLQPLFRKINNQKNSNLDQGRK
jgi:hypothetical protein